ncbi:MAG TPA: SMP-30/gluconolactonase/LRE family protein [Casimicrobiaceae bacterium]|nr:SMP-30/gluconolactonase/LRE family protein [Casimicrobiaceae bacterium]
MESNSTIGPVATDIDVFDPRFAPVVAHRPSLERLATGAIWSEGPVWIAEDDSVLWSDIPNDRMLRWSAQDGMSVWRERVEFTNGHTRDLDGTILHCSHGLRAVFRTDVDGGAQRTVVDRWEGRRFNAPNDIVVKSDGTIWFTDPPYGLIIPEEGHGGESEIGDCYVFRHDPRTGALDPVTALPEHPNGLAFSPDESLLYVSDTSGALPAHGSNHCIWVFDVVDGRRLGNGRVFAEIAPGVPDGFRLDAQGWIYTSAQDGVHVYHPDGTRLGRIGVPEKVGNVTFGGHARDILYIAASSSLYRIRLATRGVQHP